MPVTISGTSGLAGVNGSASTPAVQGEDTNTGVFFPAADTVAVATAGAERLRVDSSGNAGLGVTPVNNVLGKTFQIGQAGVWTAETGSNRWWIGSNWYYGSSADRYITTGHATLYSQQSGDHYWYSAPSGTADNPVTFTQTMSLSSGGNLLVGTTASDPISSNVAGISLGSDSIVRAMASSAPSGVFGRRTSTGDIFRFYYNGPTQVGSISTNGTSTAYNTSSDYRLKENVAPMQNALDTVAQLNPVTYTWKADGSAGQGFIAHELQAVVPDCVTGEKDAVDAEGNPQYQGVDTSFLVATLVKAIQELTARVAELEAK